MNCKALLLSILIASALNNKSFSQKFKSESLYPKYKEMLPDSLPVRVFVDFIVNAQGYVDNVKASKIECYGCNNKTKRFFKKEAEAIVNNVPKWEPATDKNGIPQIVRFTVPIKFTDE